MERSSMPISSVSNLKTRKNAGTSAGDKRQDNQLQQYKSRRLIHMELALVAVVQAHSISVRN